MQAEWSGITVVLSVELPQANAEVSESRNNVEYRPCRFIETRVDLREQNRCRAGRCRSGPLRRAKVSFAVAATEITKVLVRKLLHQPCHTPTLQPKRGCRSRSAGVDLRMWAEDAQEQAGIGPLQESMVADAREGKGWRRRKTNFEMGGDLEGR